MFEKLREAIRETKERSQNRPFLEAAMAACAHVAMADGAVSIGERWRVDDIMEHLDQLKVFDPHEGVEAFNRFVDAIARNREEGRRSAFEAIEAVADDEALALLVARICIAINEADGEFSEAELFAVQEVCEALRVAGKTPV